MRRIARVSAAIALALCSACALWVEEERDSARAARDAYDACRRDHGSRAETECAAAKARYDAELQRYEDTARRAWSCDPARPECDDFE